MSLQNPEQPTTPEEAVKKHQDMLREIIEKAPETNLADRCRHALEKAGLEVPDV